MNGDEVGLAEKLLLARVVDADLLALLRCQILAPGDDLHPERLGDLGGARAELAEAEDAEGQTLQIHADRGLPRHAGLHPRVLVADVTGQFEHQPNGNARGRIAQRRGAADDDAALIGGGDVDRRVAQAGGDEELELGQLLDHPTREGGALAHGADDLEARSEEHTSELQSQSNLVCRLLLEKNKKRHSWSLASRPTRIRSAESATATAR